jgi:hypothetical protein
MLHIINVLLARNGTNLATPTPAAARKLCGAAGVEDKSRGRKCTRPAGRARISEAEYAFMLRVARMIWGNELT